VEESLMKGADTLVDEKSVSDNDEFLMKAQHSFLRM
jgi:hypothetical protein